jgi:hypothetical protein
MMSLLIFTQEDMDEKEKQIETIRAVVGLLRDELVNQSTQIDRLLCDMREINALLLTDDDIWSICNQIRSIVRAALEGDE